MSEEALFYVGTETWIKSSGSSRTGKWDMTKYQYKVNVTSTIEFIGLENIFHIYFDSLRQLEKIICIMTYDY